MVDSSTAKENIEIQEVESGGDAYIAGIKILECFCYLVAIAISSFIFPIIFEIQNGDIIYFCIVVLLATLVFKSQLLLWAYRTCGNKRKLKVSVKRAVRFIKFIFSRLAVVLIFLKLLLFNVFSDLFLLVLFFFPSMMLLIFVKITRMNVDISTYHNLFNWGLVFLGTTGVLLAIFQYYLHAQRKSAKIISEELDKKIKSIIYTETLYDNFINYIDTNCSNKTIKEYVEEAPIYKNPILEAADRICKVQFSDKSSSEKKFIISTIKDLYASVHIDYNNMAGASSEQCYSYLDRTRHELCYNGEKNYILNAYHGFFLTECKSNIIRKIKTECNLAEAGSLFLSNTNLILDDGQNFIFGNLGDQFWEALSPKTEDSEVMHDKVTKNFETHTDYMRLLVQEISSEIMRLIFEPYSKHKYSTKEIMTEDNNK